MPSTAKARIRDTVYVVGAGFSAGLGYPMTNILLTKVWTHLNAAERKQLGKIVAFHHPDFDSARPKTFPNMERLLTEIDVNLKLFTSSRPAEGRFTKRKLEAAHDNLLRRQVPRRSNRVDGYAMHPSMAEDWGSG
jgi:hypothetical protein